MSRLAIPTVNGAATVAIAKTAHLITTYSGWDSQAKGLHWKVFGLTAAEDVSVMRFQRSRLS